MALTLDEMRAVIRRGESVMHGSGMGTRIISREEDLPTETELASGDREKLEAARTALVDRRSRLDAEIAAVESELATLSSRATGKGKKAAAATLESADQNKSSEATTTVGTADLDAAAAASMAPPAGA